ncbi:MAG: alpha-amylase family glycosyl hydrolase [Phycisphaerae bacterium]
MKARVLILLASLTAPLLSAQGLHWWNDAVFYEIFVRSYCDSDADGIGDFNGLTSKLDYLNDGNPDTTADLGITGIWLMPIMPSPSYHGYDVIDYCAINPDYGTAEDFRRFLAEAHRRGIRVLIDFVMNHTSEQHPWFLDAMSGPASKYRDYYLWDNSTVLSNWHKAPSGQYYGFFSSRMPDVNFRDRRTLDEFIGFAEFWLKDIGVDGFRLDAVKYLVENGAEIENTAGTYRILNRFRSECKKINPDCLIIAEIWDNTETVLKYVHNGSVDLGFEFDFSFVAGEAIRTGNPAKLKQAVQDNYERFPFLQSAPFLTNHDQDRIFSVLENDTKKMKLAASVLLTAPGTPFMYYGEEIALLGTKPDPELRRPMQWDDGAACGFTAGVPWKEAGAQYGSNVSAMESDSDSLLNHYKKLLKLRNESEALRRGTYRELAGDEPALYAFERQSASEHIAVIHNFSAETVSAESIELPPEKVLSISTISGEPATLSAVAPAATLILRLSD